MAYLGKTPSQATRARYYYTATGGETSLSGSDDNGNTLVFSDGNYVDVMLNGVTLVAGTDYDTDTANTIDNLSALTASDVVEIVVYDTFSVFGGNVNGNFNIQNGTLTAEAVTASGLVTAQDGLVVDNDSATVVTFDRATSDGTIVDLQKDGSTVGSIGTEGVWGSGPQFLGSNSRGFIIANPNTNVNEIIPNVDTVGKLGNSSNRWQDLYLSGGVYLGGTGAANKLEDYEEGTWTPVGNGVTFSTAVGTYTKIGRVVQYGLYVVFPSTADTTSARITQLPFLCSSGEGSRAGSSVGYGQTGSGSYAMVADNSTSLFLYNLSGSNLGNDDFSGTDLYIGGTYITDS